MFRQWITSELIFLLVNTSMWLVITSGTSSFLRSSCNPCNNTFENSEESWLALPENLGDNCVRISFCDWINNIMNWTTVLMEYQNYTLSSQRVYNDLRHGRNSDHNFFYWHACKMECAYMQFLIHMETLVLVLYPQLYVSILKLQEFDTFHQKEPTISFFPLNPRCNLLTTVFFMRHFL